MAEAPLLAPRAPEPSRYAHVSSVGWAPRAAGCGPCLTPAIQAVRSPAHSSCASHAGPGGQLHLTGGLEPQADGDKSTMLTILLIVLILLLLFGGGGGYYYRGRRRRL